MDADGAEGPGWEHGSFVKDDFRFREHHMPDDLTVFLHHEIQAVDEVRVVPVLVEDIMLGAARAIDIPKGFAGKVFHRAIVLGLFQSDNHGKLWFLYGKVTPKT